MNNNSALVITSISVPENKILQDYATKTSKHNLQYIVVGDEKSPDDFYLEGCEFLSLKNQALFGFELAKLLPTRHYARKNIGYLKAMKDGVDIIVETDDDNYARNSFWEKRSLNIQADFYEEAGWLNVYRLFTEENIWPRGFSIEHIKDAPKKDFVNKS